MYVLTALSKCHRLSLACCFVVRLKNDIIYHIIFTSGILTPLTFTVEISEMLVNMYMYPSLCHHQGSR